MNGAMLRKTLQAVLPESKILQAAIDFGAIERFRKLDIVKLVRALVLSEGSDDTGTLADARRRYMKEAEEHVVRGAFYNWMDEEMAMLLEHILGEAIGYVTTLPAYLPGVLSTVDDWLIFDSETVTLRPKLEDDYAGTGSPAAIKVHKELSLGRCCMTYCHFGPAREHDKPNLEIDERYRNKGLLVDLGYASLDFIRSCAKYKIKYIMRLKDNWKPRIDRITRGKIYGEFFPGTDLDVLLQKEVIVLDGRCIDADVTLGKGKNAVTARLVLIPGPDDEYLAYLTNLPRYTHGPEKVGMLYRCRYEIEIDNKLDKSGAQLDQIKATTDSSVRILLCASLLHSMLVNILIHQDKLDRIRNQDNRRAPLHRLSFAFAMRAHHADLLAALSDPKTELDRWNKLAVLLVEQGHDPNWRRRPSVLDEILGLTAPRGRPRRKKLRHCHHSAAPYRRVA